MYIYIYTRVICVCELKATNKKKKNMPSKCGFLMIT